jgi:hypothetical protein
MNPLFSSLKAKALAALVGGLALLAPAVASAQADLTLPEPSDDRWHYPFNTLPGFQTSAAAFSFVQTPGPTFCFDYRDGNIYLRYEPSQNPGDPDYIPSGFDPSNYEFTGAELVIHHAAGTYTWDVDNPSTNSLGIPFRMELFGLGLDSSFTTFTLQTWDEVTTYVGGSAACPSPERAPYPLNIDDSAPVQNVAKDPAATAWAVGVPDNSYTPGVNNAQPFPVSFTLDTGNPRVKAYIQEQLSAGYLLWSVGSTAQGAMGPPSPTIPRFVLRGTGVDPYLFPASFTLTGFQLVGPAAVTDWSVFE